MPNIFGIGPPIQEEIANKHIDRLLYNIDPTQNVTEGVTEEGITEEGVTEGGVTEEGVIEEDEWAFLFDLDIQILDNKVQILLYLLRN